MIWQKNQTVYPNPSVDGNVNIQSESSQILIVYDAQGKQLVRSTLNEGLNQIDLSHLPKGSYVLVTMNTVGVIEKKYFG